MKEIQSQSFTPDSRTATQVTADLIAQNSTISRRPNWAARTTLAVLAGGSAVLLAMRTDNVDAQQPPLPPVGTLVAGPGPQPGPDQGPGRTEPAPVAPLVPGGPIGTISGPQPGPDQGPGVTGPAPRAGEDRGPNTPPPAVDHSKDKTPPPALSHETPRSGCPTGVLTLANGTCVIIETKTPSPTPKVETTPTPPNTPTATRTPMTPPVPPTLTPTRAATIEGLPTRVATPLAPSAGEGDIMLVDASDEGASGFAKTYGAILAGVVLAAGATGATIARNGENVRKYFTNKGKKGVK